MEPNEAVSDQPVRRRAGKACEFCRKRKMRCGNEEPQCNNCKTYGKHCRYADLPRTARPSKAHISRLEEENRLLHARLNSTQSSGPLSPSTRPPLPGSEESISAPLPSELYSNGTGASRLARASTPETISQIYPQPSSRNPVRLAEQANYYGRTSALFDDESGTRHSLRSSGTGQGAKSSEMAELILMGEAAKQRQLEQINYTAGRLDFDGVDPDLGMHLLSLHWNRQHHSSLITYRPAFMRDMACQGPYFSKLLLNAIYFGASKFSPRQELRKDSEHVRSIGLPFRQRVRELLGGALDRSEITTIQALLIMTSSLFALGDERSAAWLYAGTAFRMIIDLGMHIDDPSRPNSRRLSDEDLEIRRRVFWGAFVVDKIQSLYQGRPVSLQETDTRVPIMFQDNFEELEHWKPFAYSGTKDYPGSPAYSVTTFGELCKLSIVMNEILNKFYAEKSEKRGPERLADDLKGLHGDLESWEANLPVHLKLSTIESTGVVPPPHVLSLLAMHKVILILLHRPFVSDGHLHATTPSIPVNSFMICAKAATQIVQLLRIYDQTFSIQHAPYLMSYATYVSATIHVRIAAQRGPRSEAHGSLSTCLMVFNKNQETNWAVRRARTVIENLMKRMNVVILEPQLFQEGVELQDSSLLVSTSSQSMAAHSHENVRSDSTETGSTFISSSGNQIHIAPDLDIDAIIQSFFPEHQNNEHNSTESSNHMVMENSYHHGAKFQLSEVDASNQSGNTSFESGYNYPSWNLAGYPTDESLVEDMLFGFNGANLDSVMEMHM